MQMPIASTTMLMVIFGAGASFDSVSPAHFGPRGDEHYKPPLAKDLFHAGPVQGSAVEQFPQCRPLLPRLRRAASDGASVERELEAIQSESDQLPSHHRMLNA